MQVLVTMKDGRPCVILGPAKGATLLLRVGGDEGPQLPETCELERRQLLIISYSYLHGTGRFRMNSVDFGPYVSAGCPDNITCYLLEFLVLK